jgi:hypothetical protein
MHQTTRAKSQPQTANAEQVDKTAAAIQTGHAGMCRKSISTSPLNPYNEGSSADPAIRLQIRFPQRMPDQNQPYTARKVLFPFILTVALFASLPAQTAGQDNTSQPAPSFRSEVMAALSKAGCNMGTCHGNANGKGGLKLSLRGQDPDKDFVTLTRQQAARRVSVLQPDDSLLLRKPLMTVPHEGGRRFEADSNVHDILTRWIAAGLPNDPSDAATLVELLVTPQHQTIYAPDNTVRLQVTARYSDDSQKDVTRLTVFESSALFVTVNADGLVSCDGHGQTTVTARYLNQQQAVRLEFVPQRDDFQFEAPAAANAIDEVVFNQLQRLKINPSPVCDDTTFLRRVYLDLTGLLPTVEQAQQFVHSDDPDKRSKLIDQLLASEEFNDQQALRWADLLRVEVKTLDKTGVKTFHSWIRQSFADHKPLNQMVSELIAARGSTYKVPPANFYRALRTPEQRAESTAQVFLGIRLQCAKCHNHPFDRWTQDDYYGWSNFFARIDYEIVENKRRDQNDKHEFDGEQIVLWKTEGEVTNPATGKPAGLRFPGNINHAAQPQPDTSTASEERLQQLAAWMCSPNNNRFAATQANRIWYQLMGRGVVDPVDDFRSTNPPSNPELLQVLTTEFTESNFDVRHLMRLITNSATYQLASSENDTNRTDTSSFSRIEPRRLTAEHTLDAMCQVLQAPAKFGDQEAGTKAVQLAGVRNGGHRYSPPEIGDRFLQLFGKPDRLQTCDCERSNETTLAQTFEMVSGELINSLLKQDNNRIATLLQADTSTTDIISQFYWAALARSPSATELETAEKYITSQPDRRNAFQDFVWALLNSNEFMLRQ